MTKNAGAHTCSSPRILSHLQSLDIIFLLRMTLFIMTRKEGARIRYAVIKEGGRPN